MSHARRWLKRLRRLVHAAEVERSMEAEFQHHLDCEIAERVASGLSPDAARREAVLAFGGVERMKEDARDARGTRAAEDFCRDTAYATRLLRRHPAFTAGVTATFALAMAATAAILSVAYGVLLRPLPYRDPERLVALWEHDLVHDAPRNVVSLPNFLAWRERAPVFTGMAALMPRAGTIIGTPVPERVPGAEVSPGYFTLLGVPPALGRDLRETDTTAIIVSDAFWKRRLSANPDAIGRSISIDGTDYIVVGVMPPGFDPPRFGWLGDQEVWYPFVPSE
jgi:putative ABC transport system permease protein